ncbi:MAG: 2-phospho-L-lactate transferase [Dehalococcoidia bacterium]|jgi:LPPG:FO 2-phospho-L-lactate transferase|nr:2-phospho-L-lactate transferase [Dehalococcoidia bacterium]
MNDTILALAGGVGGAKLALGLARVVPPGRLVICVNTGDDECFHGLHVCPDLDTVMYTLAGLSNPRTGWGLDGDTFNTLGMLREYGADAWFNLGDRDLATHIRRTQLLRQGATLSEATAELCRHLGIAHQVVPMSDDPVRTVLSTDEGELPMQSYFVRRRAEPRVREIRYDGAESARPSPVLEAALEQARLIVLCPSNPFLSVEPILALPGVRERLEKAPGLRVAVSPIVGGAAVRGPAAKIMAELGREASCVEIASQYRGLCDLLLIDDRDAHLSPAIAELGIKPVTASIIMDTEADKVAMAERVLALRAG